MLYRGTMGAMAIAGMLGVATCEAWAFDDAKYPDLKGQWIGVRGNAGGGPARSGAPATVPRSPSTR